MDFKSYANYDAFTIDKLREKGKPIVVYGTGQYARTVHDYL